MLFGDKTQKGGWLLFFGGAKLELPYTLLRKIKILGGLNRLMTTHFDLELIGLNPIPNESVLHLHLLDL
jgi:hypothetical protein